MARTSAVTKEKATSRQAVKPGKDRDIRSEILGYKEAIEESWYEIHVRLAEVYDSELYKSWGFEKFADYVAEDLGMEYRVAMWGVQVGRTIKEFDLTREQVGDIGWSKFKEVSYLFHEGMKEKEIEKLLKKAENLSLRDLQAFVKEERITGETTGRPAGRKVKMTFNLLNQQAEVVEEALEAAKSLAGTESMDVAFEYICAEWLMNHSDETDKKVMKKIHKAEAEEAAEQKAPHKKHANVGKSRGKKAESKAESTKSKKAKKAAESEADEENDIDLD